MRRRLLLGSATLFLLGCASPKDEARQQGIAWFTAEIQRIGYAPAGDGVYATPPKPAPGLLAGDQLEAQIRDVRPTDVREAALSTADRDRGVTWRGQLFFTYELRERYHRGGQPQEWSPWRRESGILSLEERAGQWYVARVK